MALLGSIGSEVVEVSDVGWDFDTLISVKRKPFGTSPKFTARLPVVSPVPGSEFLLKERSPLIVCNK